MVTHQGKNFEPYLSRETLATRIGELGEQIRKEYQGRTPLLIGVLNGAFMFTADLMRAIDAPAEVSFVKLASYEGQSSTGQLKQLVGINEPIFGRDIIVVEDIVDTGRTLRYLREQLLELGPKSVEIASLLLKPEVLEEPLDIKYLGFEIPNRFVLGYGLDFDGFGRYLPDLYQMVEN